MHWSAKVVASDHGSEVFYTVLECLHHLYCEIFACRLTKTVPGHWQLQHPPAIAQLQVDIGRLANYLNGGVGNGDQQFPSYWLRGMAYTLFVPLQSRHTF